jgi:hypothetical protein
MNLTHAPIRQALVDIWQVNSSIHETIGAHLQKDMTHAYGLSAQDEADQSQWTGHWNAQDDVLPWRWNAIVGEVQEFHQIDKRAASASGTSVTAGKSDLVLAMSMWNVLTIAVAVVTFMFAGQLIPWPIPQDFAVSIIVMAIYILFSVAIDVLIMAQKTAGNAYDFSPLCAIILTEFAKLLASLAIYLARETSNGQGEWFKGLNISDASWMALPAAFFTFNNALVFIAIGNTNAGTFGPFRDTVLIWTAGFWCLAYQLPLGSIRIAAIAIIVLGLFMNRFAESSVGEPSEWAFLSVVLMTLCNALGTVSNEMALKRNIELDINIQNMLLYAMCLSLSTLILAISDPSRLASVANFFEGFTLQTVVMVCLQASAGLLISRLLKHADAVYKSVGSCLRGPSLVVIAPLFVQRELPMSAATLGSALLVAGGSFTYLSQGPLNTSKG